MAFVELKGKNHTYIVDESEVISYAAFGKICKAWRVYDKRPLQVLISNSKMVRTRNTIELIFNHYRHSLNHTSLLKQYDIISSANGSLYTFSELIKGLSLDSFLETRKLSRKADREFYKKLILKVFDAIEFLHFNGIVVKNLTPKSILLTYNEDDNFNVKKDFDIKIIDLTASININMLEKKHAQIAFDFVYAAPEVVFNHAKIIDFRADIYSLGMIIYRIWNKEIPYFDHKMNREEMKALYLIKNLPISDAVGDEMMKVLVRATATYAFPFMPMKMPRKNREEKLSQALLLRYENIDMFREALKPMFCKK